MKVLKRNFSIFAIVILCILSRLPQLLSPNLLLDGDECIVGLMAKHILQLKNFPLFFYGQSYGFSLIECLAIIPFYAVAGITTLSVKLPMLLLWTTGVIFMYKTFSKINPEKQILPFIFILVFIFCPAWAVWSLKARGGYLTSFMLTSVVLHLVFHKKIKLTFSVSILLGLLIALIYESQPLWLPGLLPLLLYRFFKENNIQKFAGVIISSVVSFTFFYCYKKGLADNYTPPFISYDLHSFSFITRVPYYLYTSLHGYYFYNRVQKPDVFSAAFAYIFCGIIFFLCVAAIYSLAKHKKGRLLFNLSVLSLILTLAYTLCIEDVHPRYLLPVTGYTLLSLSFFVQNFNAGPKLFAAVNSVLILLGIASVVSFRNFKFTTTKESDLKQLVTYIEHNHAQYVYCYDYMLAYQIIFYANEQILCRERPWPGRYMPYTNQVDSAFNAGKKTALLYNELQLRGIPFKEVNRFNGYIVVFDPSKNDLQKIFFFKH